MELTLSTASNCQTEQRKTKIVGRAETVLALLTREWTLQRSTINNKKCKNIQAERQLRRYTGRGTGKEIYRKSDW
jgi:hypothetical protein